MSTLLYISVPPLWKDSLTLENIANDFLESNVTGEVMNLDDFLKELQVNNSIPLCREGFQQGRPFSHLPTFLPFNLWKQTNH